jgi:plastocyanin
MTAGDATTHHRAARIDPGATRRPFLRESGRKGTTVRQAGRLCAIGCAVAMAVPALAGCAPGASTADAPPAHQAGSTKTGAGKTGAGKTGAGKTGATTRPGGADCTRATKVTITPKNSGFAFSPAGLTIRRGAYLAVVNKSDATHPLRATPDAGMVTSVLDPRERQVIQFPKAGRFTIGTGDAALHLTVTGESGCGAPEPTLTITTAGTFEPATASVTATENFAVVNESADARAVSCSPGTDKDHTRLDAGETQILALDEPGRYTCADSRHPAAKVTVTVTAARGS